MRLTNEVRPVIEVFDYLEGCHQVEVPGTIRQTRGRRDGQMQISEWEARTGIPRSLGGNIECGHESGCAAEFRGAITRSTANIQYALTRCELRGERIASEVLVPQVDFHLAGDDSLPSELIHYSPPRAAARPGVHSLPRGNAGACGHKSAPQCASFEG